ncbi:MAG: HDOD domain-containing protein [Nitrospinae bacterium]|nr:HDOD domain-containing protein [Nitrospinota bacterium]
MEQGELRRLIQSAKRLPTIPIILSKIMTLLRDEKTSARQLGEIVSADQAIASKVLSIANSAYYGLSQKIISIPHAIAMLGFTAVKNIAIGTSVFSHFSEEGKGSGIDLKALWIHSFATALVSEEIGKRTSVVKPEAAFMGGLLHDIGKLILINIFHEQYKAAIDMAREKSCSICFAEDMLFGITHINAGEWLCEKWQLPNEIIQSVRYHKTPWSSFTNSELTSAVYLANYIVKKEKIGFGGDNFTPSVDERVFNALHLKETDIAGLVSFVQSKKESIENILSDIA